MNSNCFLPVLDTAGIYELGIVAADDDKQVITLATNNPASKINKYEINPMMAIVSEK